MDLENMQIFNKKKKFVKNQFVVVSGSMIWEEQNPKNCVSIF